MLARVALLGVGGIGFRHFQSLLEMELQIELYVIDISEEALEKARYHANNVIHKYVDVKLSKTADTLPTEIDVAIIATSSLVRKKLFNQLIDYRNIRYVIFEKFLFPREDDYMEVFNHLKKNNIQGYVNCPSRLYPGYIDLKQRIDKYKDVHVFVHGSNWGLACNAIHEIDKVGFLLDNYDELICDGINLDDKIHTSKRFGYVEFTGDLVCRLGDKATIFMNSSDSYNVPVEEVICNGNMTYVISEGNQTISYEENGHRKEKPFPILYQSQLTGSIVTKLLTMSKCSLTKYEDTMQWHMALLKAFKQKYDEVSGCIKDYCPIT